MRLIVTPRATGSGLRADAVQEPAQDGGKTGGRRFGRLRAGRAILLGDSDTPTYVQFVNPLVDQRLAR